MRGRGPTLSGLGARCSSVGMCAARDGGPAASCTAPREWRRLDVRAARRVASYHVRCPEGGVFLTCATLRERRLTSCAAQRAASNCHVRRPLQGRRLTTWAAPMGQRLLLIMCAARGGGVLPCAPPGGRRLLNMCAAQGAASYHVRRPWGGVFIDMCAAPCCGRRLAM